MADKQLLAVFNRLSAEPVVVGTNQDATKSYFLAPDGVTGDAVFNLTRRGLTPWKGNVNGVFTSDCGITAPPAQTNPPAWNNTRPTPSKYVAGQRYEFFVPLSSITPAAGQQLTGLQMPAYPNFFRAINEDTGIRIVGTIPDGFDQLFQITLRAYQNNDTTADQVFDFEPLVVASGTIKALVQLPAGIMRVGPDSTAAPTIQIISAPAGFTDLSGYPGTGPRSETVAGNDYFFYHGYSFTTGTYTVKITHLGQTLYAQFTYDGSSQTVALTLTTTPPGNAPKYSMQVADSINEGGPTITATAKLSGANATGGTYGLTGAGTGLSINAITGVITSAANDTVGDTYQFGVTYTVNGTVVATAMVTSVDKTPYIISIIHQYNPGTFTDTFLVKHSATENDTTRLPQFRVRRAEEGSFQGAFAGLDSSQNAFSQFNQGYRLYTSFNLTAAGQNSTSGVIQFRPYPTAPDSGIIALTFSHNDAGPQDYGTEIYSVSGIAPPADPNDQSSETDTTFLTASS